MAPGTYTVQRSATIDAPPRVVYKHVADFRRWTAWSPWEAVDPDMARTYSGATSGTGSVYAWSGNRRAGEGRMTIRAATKPSRVAIDLEFEKPFRSRNDTVFTIEREGSGSRVTWTMTGPVTLGTRVMSLLKPMDAIVGPDFEKGLARLKQVAEGRSAG